MSVYIFCLLKSRSTKSSLMERLYHWEHYPTYSNPKKRENALFVPATLDGRSNISKRQVVSIYIDITNFKIIIVLLKKLRKHVCNQVHTHLHKLLTKKHDKCYRMSSHRQCLQMFQEITQQPFVPPVLWVLICTRLGCCDISIPLEVTPGNLVIDKRKRQHTMYYAIDRSVHVGCFTKKWYCRYLVKWCFRCCCVAIPSPTFVLTNDVCVKIWLVAALPDSFCTRAALSSSIVVVCER